MIPPSGRRLQSAISLLELVVAIAVLVVLAVLLASASRSMSISSKQVSCLSQLKQWGTVFHQYTSEHKGAFPGVFPFNDGKAWYHYSSPIVQLYLLDGRDDDETVERWNSGEGINGCREHPDLYASYAYNFHLGHRTAVNAQQYRGNLAQVTHPASFLMLTDALAKNDAPAGFSLATPDRIGRCHAGRFNALYVDGHVESQTEVDVYQIFPE